MQVITSLRARVIILFFFVFCQAASAKSQDVPPMQDDQFWGLIALVSPTLLHDEETEVAAFSSLSAALIKLTERELLSFEITLTNKLYALDTSLHAKQSASGNSDDGFLYARCYVVAMGKDFYEKALANPKLMPKSLQWAELLLYVAAGAWSIRTGKDSLEFTDLLPVAGKRYETGSNPAFNPH